eukprot:2281834-Prymnesium_polylepis.2
MRCPSRAVASRSCRDVEASGQWWRALGTAHRRSKSSTAALVARPSQPGGAVAEAHEQMAGRGHQLDPVRKVRLRLRPEPEATRDCKDGTRKRALRGVLDARRHLRCGAHRSVHDGIPHREDDEERTAAVCGDERADDKVRQHDQHAARRRHRVQRVLAQTALIDGQDRSDCHRHSKATRLQDTHRPLLARGRGRLQHTRRQAEAAEEWQVVSQQRPAVGRSSSPP